MKKKATETALFPSTDTNVETPAATTMNTTPTPREQTKSAEQVRVEGIKDLASRYDTLEPSEKLKLRKFIDADIQLVIRQLERTLSGLKAELASTLPQGELPLATGHAPRAGIKPGSNKEKVLNAVKELGANVSAGAIAAKSGVKQPSSLLKALVTEGKLTKAGKSRGTTYTAI